MKTIANIVVILSMSGVVFAIPGSNMNLIRADYLEDINELIEEHESRLYRLRKRYVQVAERELKRAMSRGDLEDANAWNEWIKELESATKRRGADITKYATFNEPIKGNRENVSFLYDGVVPDGVPADDRRFWFPAHNNGKMAWWFEARWDRMVLLTGMSFVCPNGLKAFPVGGHAPLQYEIIAYRGERKVRAFSFSRHPHARAIQKGKAVEVDIPLPQTTCDRVKFRVLEVNGNQHGPILWEARFYGRR